MSKGKTRKMTESRDKVSYLKEQFKVFNERQRLAKAKALEREQVKLLRLEGTLDDKKLRNTLKQFRRAKDIVGSDVIPRLTDAAFQSKALLKNFEVTL